MTFSAELIALGRYLAGEFHNQQQALAQPAWYVHLRLWQRPVPLFTEDSLTLFAEQANIVNLDQPYRPRILRLQQIQVTPPVLQVQYYMCQDPMAVRGAGQNPAILQQLTPEQLEFLPGCSLKIEVALVAPNVYKFITTNPSGTPCSFTYQNQTYQVSLGFAVTSEELLVYDQGIDTNTGKAIWGALLGPYCFSKREDFSAELPV